MPNVLIFPSKNTFHTNAISHVYSLKISSRLFNKEERGTGPLITELRKKEVKVRKSNKSIILYGNTPHDMKNQIDTILSFYEGKDDLIFAEIKLCLITNNFRKIKGMNIANTIIPLLVEQDDFIKEHKLFISYYRTFMCEHRIFQHIIAGKKFSSIVFHADLLVYNTFLNTWYVTLRELFGERSDVKICRDAPFLAEIRDQLLHDCSNFSLIKK